MQDLLARPLEQAVRDKMGKLNIASSGLLTGATGQEFFDGLLFPCFPAGRAFRYCLMSAMCRDAGVTLPAETLFLIVQLALHGHLLRRWARALTCLGALSLIVFRSDFDASASL